MRKNAPFSRATLEQALHDLQRGKTLDQYNLPASVKRSIAATRYTSQDVAAACAKVEMPKRVFSF